MSASPLTLAQQNDAFRQGMATANPILGQRVHTRRIEALGLEVILDVWRDVRHFGIFTKENDPYGEHDFGSFTHRVAGKVFWKIDYYNLDYARGSEDPCDPSKTRRVLTVMLASEY